MIQVGFNTVATLMALHIPAEIAAQFKSLHELNVQNDNKFQGLVDLTESNCMSLMHDAYENMTPQSTPLHILPVFVSCFEQFLHHEDVGHLSNFICSVHDNPERVKQELAKKGITATYNDDGVTIETGGKPILHSNESVH